MTKTGQKAPTFFPTAAELRAWFDEHHTSEPELRVGFYKKGSGLPSVTWPEAVDEALCFGWIDGVRNSVDDVSYLIRFTPRRARSTWSAVNIERARVLADQGLMRPAGIAAFEARAAERSGIYSYEQRNAIDLGEAFEAEFRSHPQAWEYFQTQPASYRKAAIWWVVNAKKDETKRKRLATVIDDSANGRTVQSLTPPSARTPSS